MKSRRVDDRLRRRSRRRLRTAHVLRWRRSRFPIASPTPVLLAVCLTTNLSDQTPPSDSSRRSALARLVGDGRGHPLGGTCAALAIWTRARS